MINAKRITDNFIKLGAIDSPSGHEDKVRAEIVRQIKPLANAIRTDKFGNVLARINGPGRPLLLAAHMDTAASNNGFRPMVRRGIVSNWGRGLCGADNKAAVAAIIEVLQSFKQDKKKLPALEILITVQEEAGLHGARNFDYRWLSAKQAVCFDRGDEIPTVVLAAPFIRGFEIEFSGKAAHAGAHAELGRSAIAAAADFIAAFKLGRVDKATTMNIGVISGGQAINIVPDQCVLTGEFRTHNANKQQWLIDKIDNELTRIDNQRGVKTKPRILFDIPGYALKRNSLLIKKIRRAHRQLGWTTKWQVTNAGADANLFNQRGLEAVNTGYGAQFAHTNNEQIAIRELVRLAAFIQALIVQSDK